MTTAEAKARPYLPVKAKTEDWATPPSILDPVREIFGGVIDLDPCGNPYSVVGAKRQVWLPKWLGAARMPPPSPEVLRLIEKAGLKPDRMLDRIINPPMIVERTPPPNVHVGNGLEVEWKGRCFFNPAYSHKLLGAFMSFAANACDGHAIGLVPCKTDIAAWHASVPSAAAVCFLKGRVKHLLPDGTVGDPAPMPQALVLWTRSRELQHRFSMVLDGKLGDVMVHS